MKEDDVVVVSSDSEEEEEIVWMRKNQNKQYQLLWEKTKPILYYQVQPGYKLSTSFPYARFQELANDLKNSLALVNVKSTQAFIWKNVIRWLLSIKLCYENVSDCMNDKNYNLILTDFMAQYVNYKCQLHSSITDETEVKAISNEIVVTLSLVFSGWVPGIVMTLLKIQVIDDYQLILYPIFRKYLSNKHLHQTHDLISYLRLILCFRKWKKLAHLKEDKEIINEIAVGKSAKALRSDIIDLSTETSDIEPVLPKTVPSVNEDNRSFANITGLIGFAAKNQEYGTRILLINKTLELDDTIEQFFKRYNEYINRSTPKLLEWSRADLKPTLIEDLTRSPSPDQLLPRTSCSTLREKSQMPNKNNINEKQGTKAVNQHLSNNCDISSISVNNKFNNLNLNFHTIENLSPSCKNIPQNRNNDVEFSLRINNVVDLDDTNDEESNNDKNTSVSSEQNSNAEPLSVFEKRIAGAIDRLKNRAIIVGDLVNRVNVERINNPAVAAVSSDESSQSNAELPVVQAINNNNNIEAPLPNPVPMRASVNFPNEVSVEKPIRKRHGIVSSTTSFEGTGDDSDNSDDDDGFGIHNRFPFSQRSSRYSKVVEEATSSTNEIPKTPSNFTSQPRRSISSSPCPTRPSSPSPDRWSNISPSSTIRSGSSSRLEIAAGISIAAERTASFITDGERPTCSRYVAIPVTSPSLPNHNETSQKEKVQSPSLENLTLLIDKESNITNNLTACIKSATDKCERKEEKCFPNVLASDNASTRTDAPIIEKLTVSEVDTNTCAVNELLKNISGFIGDLQEEYGFESSKNKCGPDKSPGEISKTPTTEAENESNDDPNSKNVDAHLPPSEAKHQNTDVEQITTKSCDMSLEKELDDQVKTLKILKVPQESNVLPPAIKKSTNATDKTNIFKLQENSLDISTDESTERHLNEEMDTESYIEQLAVEEQTANSNLSKSNRDKKSTEGQLVPSIENDKLHKQTDEFVKISENNFISIDEKSTNKIDSMEEFLNKETVDDKTQIEKTEPVADEENSFEAIVDDESSIDDIESPPYELICQSESLDTTDVTVKKGCNKDNDDCQRTLNSLVVLKNTKTIDQSVENTSSVEGKVGSNDKTTHTETNTKSLENNESQLQHLEERDKLETKEKVCSDITLRLNCKNIFEPDEINLTNQRAKDENISDKQAQIIDLPTCSEEKKLQIKEIINYDHDYITIKYPNSSSYDQRYDKPNDNSKACSSVELTPVSEISTVHNYSSYQILETFDDNTIVSKQENKPNDREISKVTELQTLKRNSFYEETTAKVNDNCQKDQSFEDLPAIHDSILTTTSQSDSQPYQEDSVEKKLPSTEQAEDDDLNNRAFKISANLVISEIIKKMSVNKAETMKENTSDCKEMHEDQLFDSQTAYDESLIDKLDDIIENKTSDAKEIEEDQCVSLQLTSDRNVTTTDIEFNSENELTLKHEDEEEHGDTTKPLKIHPTIFQKEQIIKNQSSYDEHQSISKEITCDLSDTSIDVKLNCENVTETVDNKQPLNLKPNDDKVNEAIEKQTIEISEGQSTKHLYPVGDTTPIDTEFNAEDIVPANIEDTNEENKEPLNISKVIDQKEENKEPINKSKSIDQKETFGVTIIDIQSVTKQTTSKVNLIPVDSKLNVENVLAAFTKDDTEDEVSIKSMKFFPEIYKTNTEIIEKQTSNAKKIEEEDLSVIQQLSSTPIDGEINSESLLSVISEIETENGENIKRHKIDTEINSNVETFVNQTKEINDDQSAFGETNDEKTVIPIHNVEKYKENVSNKEPPNTSPSIEKIDELIENPTVDIKEIHSEASLTPMHTQHQNETTKNSEQFLKNSCITDPPKLSPVIENVIIENKITKNTCVIERSEQFCKKLEDTNDHCSLSSTKNVSEMQKSSSTLSKVANNCLEVELASEVRKSPLPAKIVDNDPLTDIVSQEKAKVLSLGPSSEDMLCKSQPSQPQKTNNEIDTPPMDETRRRLIIRIAKLSILEDALFKRKSGAESETLSKTITLDEQQLKQLKSAEDSNESQIKKETTVDEKNILKKNKSSKKSNRKKIKKEKKRKQALEAEAEKVKESINVPITESKILLEEQEFNDLKSISIQTENKVMTSEENAEKEQYEETKIEVISKNDNESSTKVLKKAEREKYNDKKRDKRSTKKSKRKTKNCSKANICEEEIKEFNENPIQGSKSLPEEQIFKLGALVCQDHKDESIDNKSYVEEDQSVNRQINLDKSVSAIDNDFKSQFDAGEKNDKNKKTVNTSSIIDQNDESIEKQTFEVEKIVKSETFSVDNTSAIDTVFNDVDDSENMHTNLPVISPLIAADKDKAIKQQIVNVEQIHEKQNHMLQTTSNENVTPIQTQDQCETKTADSEHLASKDKIEPLKKSSVNEEKVIFSTTKAQDKRIEQWDAKNDLEREVKLEMVENEIHMPKCSTLSSIVEEELTTEVRGSSLPPKVVAVESFREEIPEADKQEIPFHKPLMSSLKLSLDIVDKNRLSPYQQIKEEVYSPTKDESRRKLIIRIPKLSVLKDDLLNESTEKPSVCKRLTFEIHKQQNDGEYSDEHQIIQETSSQMNTLKKNKSSTKLFQKQQKIKSNKLMQGSKTTNFFEDFKFSSGEQVRTLPASETLITNQITFTEKNSNVEKYNKPKLQVAAENANEGVEGGKKTRDKISTKKNKAVHFEIQGAAKHSFEDNFKESVQIPTKDIKASLKEQALNLDISKCLTTRIESGDTKLDLKKSVLDPVLIEENTISRNKNLINLINSNPNPKTKQDAIIKISKPKEGINELLKTPTQNISILSPVDKKVNNKNASESTSIQAEHQKTVAEGNLNKDQLRKNKPKVTVENVIEHKSFAKAILGEYMKESAKKNTNKNSVEIGCAESSENLMNEEDKTIFLETSTDVIDKRKIHSIREHKSGTQNCSGDTVRLHNKNITPNEVCSLLEPIATSALSISKPSTEIEILQTSKEISKTAKRSSSKNTLKSPVGFVSSVDSIPKKVKFAECQTEPKSIIMVNDQTCSSKCQKFKDSTGNLNANKWQPNVLQNIVQCKDELIKNRNQEVFSQIRQAKLRNSIEPDSSSQVATELQRTENTITEEESNLSTRVQVADLGEPSLISDSEISQQNASVALESDKSIVFYPSRDSAEDQEVSCITSQKSDDNEVYYNYNDENGTPVMDEKNSTDDESPSSHCKITSLSKIKVPTADVHSVTPVLLIQNPQIIKPTEELNSDPKEPEPKPISIDSVEKSNVRPDESVSTFWGAADENLELWLKKLGKSKNCALNLNRGISVSNSNSTKFVENSLENQKNDRKQKKPRRVQKIDADAEVDAEVDADVEADVNADIADQKSFNLEDYKAAAILTSLKTRQKKVHKSRKLLQPTRITRSATQLVESFLHHDSEEVISSLNFSENLCEKDPLDNTEINEKCSIPSSIQNDSELTQLNASSCDSDDTVKLVIDLDAKKLPKSKTHEKSKSKKNRKEKGTTSPKTTLKKNTKVIKKLSFNPIVHVIDENTSCQLKRCRGRPRVSKDLPIKSPEPVTETRSRRGTPKQKKNKQTKTKSDAFVESFEELKPPIEKDKAAENKSYQIVNSENKNKLKISIDVPHGKPENPVLTKVRNEEPSSSSNYESPTRDNFNKETLLKYLTLRKTSKSLDTEVEQLSGNVSKVKRVLSEPNLFRFPKKLKDTNNTAGDESKIIPKHDTPNEMVVLESPNLKVPIKDIEKEEEELKTQKELKSDKCIGRSVEENNPEKTSKNPKKPIIGNEEVTTLKKQIASVTTSTIKAICVEETKQKDVPSETVESVSLSNSDFESIKNLDLAPENKTVSLPKPNQDIDRNEPKAEKKTAKVEEIIEDTTQIKSIADKLNKAEKIAGEVEKQVKIVPKKVNKSAMKSISKTAELLELEHSNIPPKALKINEELHDNKGMDSNHVNLKEKQPTSQQIIENIAQMKSTAETLKKTEKTSELSEVEKQVKLVSKKVNKSAKKTVELLDSEQLNIPPEAMKINEEQHDDSDMGSNDVNLKEKLPKSHQKMLTDDKLLSSDPSSTIITDIVIVDNPQKVLISSTEEARLKSSVSYSSVGLEEKTSRVGLKKKRCKSNCEREILEKQVEKRLKRLSLDSQLSPENIFTIERNAKNLINFSQISEAIKVKTPTKKEDLQRVLDICISNILETQLSNASDSAPINGEDGRKQDSDVDNKEKIKKSLEIFPKRKRPSLGFQRRRSNSTSDVPNILPSESFEVAGCEKDQEALNKKPESEAKKARVLSFTNLQDLEIARDFLLVELNAENFNDTREDLSSQGLIAPKVEPQQSVQSLDCMFSGNRGQDDEDKLLIFNTDLALETVPTYSPDENVDLYPFDDFYSFTPTSTLINGSENVSGGNSDSGEKPKTEIKKTDFTPKGNETMTSSEKAKFEGEKSSTKGEKPTIDVRTSEYELNESSTNISCLKTKLIKSPVVKLFQNTTTPEKKCPTEETAESSKLKSRQKPFWKKPTKPKVVEETSVPRKLDRSTSVISLSENPFPIVDDVKSFSVYFDQIFEEKTTKTPSKNETSVIESKKQRSANLSTDDTFDRLKNESPVNTYVNKAPTTDLNHSLSLKSGDNCSTDLCSKRLDEPKTQSISFDSTIPSISSELCEQKDETNKSLDISILDQTISSHSVKTTASYKQSDETQKSVLESNTLEKEIEETKKSYEQMNETDVNLRNIVVDEDNNTYSKKPMRRSRIPSVKNSPEKVNVLQINEETKIEKQSSSKHLCSKTLPFAAAVSPMPSISTLLVTPTILDPCEHKIIGKASCSKKPPLKESVVTNTPETSDKTNTTQPTPETKIDETFNSSQKQNSVFSNAKNELPSNVSCSAPSVSVVSTSPTHTVVASSPMHTGSSGTPKILDPCEHKISVKDSCSEKIPAGQSFVMKTADTIKQINETQPTPEIKIVELSKPSSKRCLSITNVTNVHEHPSKILRSEISATSVSLQQEVSPSSKQISTGNLTTSKPIVLNVKAPTHNQTMTKPSMLQTTSSPIQVVRQPLSGVVVSSMSSVAPTILDPCENKMLGKTSYSKKPSKQSMVTKSPDLIININKTHLSPENKIVETSKPSLKRYPSSSDATAKIHEHPSKIFCSETSATFHHQVSSTPNQITTLTKIPYCNLTNLSPNANAKAPHATNQTITKSSMLQKNSSTIVAANIPLPRQKSTEPSLQLPVSLPSQSTRTITPVHSTDKAVSISFRKSTTSSSTTPETTYSDKHRSTSTRFGTPRSNNIPSSTPRSNSIPSSTPRSTSSISSSSATRTNSWSADLARVSAELENIKKDVSKLPAVDYKFTEFKHRKFLLQQLESKEEELNELKKKVQEYEKHIHVSKSYSERKAIDRDNQQHLQQQHQERSSSQQFNDLKRKHDQLRPHSERQFSKSHTSGHNSHVERQQKKPNRGYVNKFSELDKLSFNNKNYQSSDTKPEVKKLLPWDPKPLNADEIIRTLRRK